MAFFVLLDKIAIQNDTRWTMRAANNEFAEEMEMVSRVRGVWLILESEGMVFQVVLTSL